MSTKPAEYKAARTRDAERTQAQILLAARDEFAEHGFAGARTGRIAKAARVPQGLLYHYFASKEALFQAVKLDTLRPYFQATVDLLRSHPEDGSPEGILENAIRTYFDFLRRNPPVVRLMAWWVAERGREQGAVMAQDQSYDPPMQLGAQRIAEAQRAGYINPTLDPEAVIRSFLALCDHWHMTFGRCCGGTSIDFRDPRAVAAAHDAALDHIVNLVLEGSLTEAGARLRRERLQNEAEEG